MLKKINEAPFAARKDTEEDVNGYARDWNVLSLQFREKHNFTCERCGWSGTFMEGDVHE